MARENKSKFAVLGFLSWGPMSGYDIKKLVEASVGNFWSESYGQIYPILRRLEAEGMAERSVEEGDGRPDRHVYRITRPGLDGLQKWLAEPALPEIPRVEILLKLFFARQVGPEQAVELVELHARALAEDLARYEALEAALQTTYAGEADLPYWLLTVRYGRKLKEALLDWSEETLGTLRGIAQGGRT